MDVQRHARVLLGETSECSRQHAIGEVLHRPEPHRALESLFTERRHGALARGEDLARVRHEHLARASEDLCSTAALEQRVTDQVAQPRHLQAHRRWRQRDDARRLRHRTGLHGRDEGPQQLDWKVLHETSSSDAQERELRST